MVSRSRSKTRCPLSLVKLSRGPKNEGIPSQALAMLMPTVKRATRGFFGSIFLGASLLGVPLARCGGWDAWR